MHFEDTKDIYLTFNLSEIKQVMNRTREDALAVAHARELVAIKAEVESRMSLSALATTPKTEDHGRFVLRSLLERLS